MFCVALHVALGVFGATLGGSSPCATWTLGEPLEYPCLNTIALAVGVSNSDQSGSYLMAKHSTAKRSASKTLICATPRKR